MDRDLDALSTRDAYVIEVGGGVRRIEAAAVRFTLAELQRVVGGYVETVGIPGRNAFVLLVDEDGRTHGAPPNVVASLLVGRDIVGTALVLRWTALGD